MKKTLAAVLAAAMALSTATVAFARDTMEGETILEDLSTVGTRQTIAKGKEYSYVISAEVLGDAADISATDLGKWVKNGDATVTVSVTEGMSKLASKPTATVKNILTEREVAPTYKWASSLGEITVEDQKGKDVTVVKGGEKITAIPVQKGDATLATEFVPGLISRVIYPGDSDWKKALNKLIEDHPDWVDSTDRSEISTETAPVVQIKFKVADDWGTGSDDIGLKFRITFKKDVGGYSKGDTVMAGEALFSAKYEVMNDKGTEMELTRPECGTNDYRQVLMNKDGELYDKIGNDEFTLYFENAAAFTGKMSANQKTLNMYYTLDADDDGNVLQDMYPDVDFEFIKFEGTPSFVNTGKMTFSAVGGGDTVVYEWDGEGWSPISDKTNYNKTYNTVEVKGIKRLGKYAIASEILPVEEEPEEPAEPVDSTPVAEPDNDEGGNPNTGAC